MYFAGKFVYLIVRPSNQLAVKFPIVCCGSKTSSAIFNLFSGGGVVEWLNSWLAEQEVQGLVPGLTT